MSYKALKEKFDKAMSEMTALDEFPDAGFKAWLLLLLFEIHGDMDSMAASVSRLEKHYAEMLDIQKERAGR